MLPEERTLCARIGAESLHGQRDSRETTSAARAKFLSGFEEQALEAAQANGEELTEGELTRRAQHLRKAHMYKLALASAKARRKKAK